MIDKSPWFKTEAAAKAFVTKCSKKNEQTEEEYRARMLEETGCTLEELERAGNGE